MYAFPPARFRSLLLPLLVACTAVPLLGQSVPGDLVITGTAGGLAPHAETITLRIAADGQGTYARYYPDDPATPVLEANAFTLTGTDVAQLWQTIQANGFFGLDSLYANETLRDGAFAELSVTADGLTHTVSTRNGSVEAFDAVVAKLNELTPGDDDLVYDIDEPVAVTPVDICERPGKRDTAPPWKESGKLADDPFGAVTASVRTGEPHAGTSIAYRISLEEAVARGIASLSAKGESFGDAVQITIDNSAGEASDRLEMSLYLEFWGPEASASTVQAAELGIESVWAGHATSSGDVVYVDVIPRVSPGGSSAPGTPGYHQIKLVESGISVLSGGFDVNQGTGTGTWRTTGSQLLEMYAHEAGHLLGLPDRYDDYRKQADGSWKLLDTGETFTTEELAAELAPRYPDDTVEELVNWLEDKTRVTPPEPGSENDIMAVKSKEPIQSDIDALAAQAGLIVEVRAGDTFVNKWGSRQNMTVTRDEDVFVPAGSVKSLEGLYAACIDRASGIPNPGDVFDLAPPISEWSGIEAAEHVSTLLRYLNDRELFCRSDRFAQSVLWRLTNNSGTSDGNISAYLADAGIDVGYRDLDFPRLSNPNFSDPNTASLTPPQLFVPQLVASSGSVFEVAEPVTFTAGLDTPRPDDPTPAFRWVLDAPDASAAALQNREGASTALTPDVRGFYEVTLRATLADSLTGAADPGAGTFTQSITRTFVAADSLVETFESGRLDSDGPFLWRTGGGLGEPWRVTDGLSHTGAYSVRSGPIGDDASTTLQARFEQVADGQLSFTYRLAAHFTDTLLFAVDGVVYERWRGNDPWTTVTVDLPAGTHTVAWTYKKDASDSIGADRVWLDDVFFPESALFTAVEESGPPNGEGVPGDGPAPRLLGNYPNPFAGTTTISYEISRAGPVELVVYDVLGRPVEVLASGMQPAGTHTVRFGAGDHANGVYHVLLRVGDEFRRGTIVLMR